MNTYSTVVDQLKRKLDWANRHRAALIAEIEAFESCHSYTLRLDIDEINSGYIVRIGGLRPVPAHWALAFGDCIHNARSVLDHLAVALCARHTGRVPGEIESIGFPITRDGCELKSKSQRDLALNLGSAVVERMNQLQAVHGWDPQIWGPIPVNEMVHIKGILPHTPPSVPVALKVLRELDNADKHRIIHAAWHSFAWYRRTELSLPPGIESVRASWTNEALQNGAVIGRIEVAPTPVEFHASDVDMRAAFPLVTTLDENSLKITQDSTLGENSIPAVLNFCLWAVEYVVEVFEPALSLGASPTTLWRQ